MCAFGLAGFTFGLIRQPEAGWGDPTVFVPLVGGVVLLAAFLLYEARASHPMLPLSLFRRRNFSVANAETLLVYAGLGLLFFFLVLFLQQVAGYSALEAGTSALPVTILMFLLSKRFGALADRYGPRFFMAVGPLVAGVGMALLLRLGPDVDYLTDLLPALVLFGVGLSMTVAPLTATVLAGADEHNAGIASGVNNAVARVAGLVGVAAVGAVVAASFDAKLDTELEASARSDPAIAAAVEKAKSQPLAVAERPPVVQEATEDASVDAFHLAMGISALLVFGGGLLGAAIENPRRKVKACDCPGGQLAGHPRPALQSGIRSSPPRPEAAGWREA